MILYRSVRNTLRRFRQPFVPGRFRNSIYRAGALHYRTGHKPRGESAPLGAIGPIFVEEPIGGSAVFTPSRAAHFKERHNNYIRLSHY